MSGDRIFAGDLEYVPSHANNFLAPVFVRMPSGEGYIANSLQPLRNINPHNNPADHMSNFHSGTLHHGDGYLPTWLPR